MTFLRTVNRFSVVNRRIRGMLRLLLVRLFPTQAVPGLFRSSPFNHNPISILKTSDERQLWPTRAVRAALSFVMSPKKKKTMTRNRVFEGRKSGFLFLGRVNIFTGAAAPQRASSSPAKNRSPQTSRETFPAPNKNLETADWVESKSFCEMNGVALAFTPLVCFLPSDPGHEV